MMNRLVAVVVAAVVVAVVQAAVAFGLAADFAVMIPDPTIAEEIQMFQILGYYPRHYGDVPERLDTLLPYE